eukprot:5468335-Prorocentrum_lima.AAC.1
MEKTDRSPRSNGIADENLKSALPISMIDGTDSAETPRTIRHGSNSSKESNTVTNQQVCWKLKHWQMPTNCEWWYAAHRGKESSSWAKQED